MNGRNKSDAGPMEPPPKLQAGAAIAHRFRIMRLLGRGGMAEVYEATDTALGTTVAIKLLTGINIDIERLRREVLAARSVTHPNVCRIHDLHETTDEAGEPLHFISMEYLGGLTLAERIRSSGRLNRDDALPIFQQIASGLDAAHA